MSCSQMKTTKLEDKPCFSDSCLIAQDHTPLHLHCTQCNGLIHERNYLPCQSNNVCIRTPEPSACIVRCPSPSLEKCFTTTCVKKCFEPTNKCDIKCPPPDCSVKIVSAHGKNCNLPTVTLKINCKECENLAKKCCIENPCRLKDTCMQVNATDHTGRIVCKCDIPINPNFGGRII